MNEVKYPSHCDSHNWYYRGCKACQAAYRRYIMRKRLQERRDKAEREATEKAKQPTLENWVDKGVELNE